MVLSANSISANKTHEHCTHLGVPCRLMVLAQHAVVRLASSAELRAAYSYIRVGRFVGKPSTTPLRVVTHAHVDCGIHTETSFFSFDHVLLSVLTSVTRFLDTTHSASKYLGINLAKFTSPSPQAAHQPHRRPSSSPTAGLGQSRCGAPN